MSDSIDKDPVPTPIYEHLTPEEQEMTEEGIIRGGWVVAVDPNPQGKPIYEYQLVLAPAADGESFAVFRCSDDILLPQDAAMVVLGPTGQMVTEGYQYNLLYGQLVTESQINEVESEYYISLPPEMKGRTIPETECLDEELWQLICASVAAQHGVTDKESKNGAFKRFSSWISSLWK